MPIISQILARSRANKVIFITQTLLEKSVAKVMEMVRHGEEVVIQDDKSGKNIATIIQWAKDAAPVKRRLGILKGKASFSLKDDFKMSDEDLFTS